MRIADHMLNAVCFIGRKVNDDFRLLGTAFFVRCQSRKQRSRAWNYLVTARHCIDRHCDEALFARINTPESSELLELPSHWVYPENPAVDVAILRLDVDPSTFETGSVWISSAASKKAVIENGIGIGSEVVAVGLFARYHGRHKNLPVVRHGILSAMPREPLNDDQGQDFWAYLVELQSISGLSGSPVYVFVPSSQLMYLAQESAGVAAFQKNYPAGFLFLLGLVRGHYDEATGLGSVHTGMAIVTPIAEVIDLLQQNQELRADRQRSLELSGSGSSALAVEDDRWGLVLQQAADVEPTK